MYLFLLDVSYNALQGGGLQSFCEVLADELDKLPGDSRALIGFISYNSSVHFYNLSDDLSTPQMHVVSDVDGMSVLYSTPYFICALSSKSFIKSIGLTFCTSIALGRTH